MTWLRRTIPLPLSDYLAALPVCFDRFTPGRALAFLVSLTACWWVYVPIHELGHVLGCVATGGEVTRLEIAEVYGGALFAKIFPFVVSGSEYAGRLSGFDTRGSDLTYLATDFFPYLLTVFLGIPLLLSAARGPDRPLAACARLGAAIPLAYVPFVSVTGDYYEMGSVIVSRAVSLLSSDFSLDRWRSDDLPKLVAELSGSPAGLGAADVAGLTASVLVAIVLIYSTYVAGRAWAAVALRRPHETTT